jgi:hypothetical protein
MPAKTDSDKYGKQEEILRYMWDAANLFYVWGNNNAGSGADDVRNDC